MNKRKTNLSGRLNAGVFGLCLLAAFFLATGCGNKTVNAPEKQAENNAAGNIRQTDTPANPPFQNSLKVEVGPLDTRYDPHSAATATFTKIHVRNAEGQAVILDARKQPILFVAYWCPHCQRTLVMFTKHEQALNQLPAIVTMGFQPGTTLTEAKRLTGEEHTALGLSNDFKFYYGLNVNGKKLVPVGYPTMVYFDGKKLDMLYAEHTLAVWKHALALAK